MKLTIGILIISILGFLSCRKEPNNGPVPPFLGAHAGADRVIISPVDTVMLDGSKSHGAATYAWKQVAGPSPSVIANASAVKTIVSKLIAGVYKFELLVTGSGVSSTDTLQVTVYDPATNRPPVANAGKDIFINERACGLLRWVELDGSASFDPDSTKITYHWQQISGPSCIVSNNGSVEAIVLNIRSGLYVFELIVKDANLAASRDTVVVDATKWTIPEYNLDITLNGTYSFIDNSADCSDGPCTYSDYFSFEGTETYSPLGFFKLHLGEMSDSSSSSNNYSAGFYLRSETRSGNYVYLSGNGPVFLKKILLSGGGVVNGSLVINESSVQVCDKEKIKNLAPLILTGTLDTSTKKLSLNIKGKVYF